MNIPVADIVVIVVYFVGIMGVGAWFMRGSGTSEGFTAAGRSLPGWVCGMSIFATFVSSISFIALPGSSFSGNWSRFTFSLTLPLATWMAVRFFMPLYRASGEISAYSYLERRFGPAARVYAATFYLLTQISRIGMVTLLTAMPLHELLGVNVYAIVIVMGVSVTIYSLMGGIEAVIWTDAIQGFILIGGALLCAVWLVFGIPGGVSQMVSIAAENNKFSLGSMDITDLAHATFWVILLNGIFANLQNFGIDQNYIQRYITSKNDAEARKAVWLGGLLYIPVSLIFFFIGTALFAYYHAHPDLLPEAVRANPDRVFPFFIVHVLPAGLTGLLIAALLAAAMSTIATSINSSATIIYNDFYKRFARRTIDEAESMLVLRGMTLLWGLVGTGVAFYLAYLNDPKALDLWWTMASIFSGGMLGLFLLGYFVPKANGMAALVGMIFGLAVILCLSLPQKAFIFLTLPQPPQVHSFLVIVFGTTVIFITGALAAPLTQRR